MIEKEIKPTNLKTEMLGEAYEIGTKNSSFHGLSIPIFMMIIKHRILVSSTSKLKSDICDSGWIESNENSFVHLSELSLLTDTRKVLMEFDWYKIQMFSKSGENIQLN